MLYWNALIGWERERERENVSTPKQHSDHEQYWLFGCNMYQSNRKLDDPSYIPWRRGEVTGSSRIIGTPSLQWSKIIITVIIVAVVKDFHLNSKRNCFRFHQNCFLPRTCAKIAKTHPKYRKKRTFQHKKKTDGLLTCTNQVQNIKMHGGKKKIEVKGPDSPFPESSVLRESPFSSVKGSQTIRRHPRPYLTL